jgi:hypothetical protein
MIGHTHLTNKKQNISASTTTEKYVVYYIVLYLFAVVVVVAGTAVVLPIILLQSEEVAAGPGSVYIPGMSSKYCAYVVVNCSLQISMTHLIILTRLK